MVTLLWMRDDRSRVLGPYEGSREIAAREVIVTNGVFLFPSPCGLG